MKKYNRKIDVTIPVYNDAMRNAYIGDKLNGIIPCISIFELIIHLTMINKEEIYYG